MPAKLISSFKWAIMGIIYSLRTQRNLRRHMALGTVAVALGIFVGLSAIEWAALSLTISMVITAELINTAIESCIDLFTQDKSKLAETAKDVAAGAVLISAINAVAVGLFIFVPKFFS